MRSDNVKQAVIVAQSSTRLAVEVAISQGDVSKEYIKAKAEEIYAINLHLLDSNIGKYKEIQEEDRKEDLVKIIKSIKDINGWYDAWNSFTEEEQIKYKLRMEKLKKNGFQ